MNNRTYYFSLIFSLDFSEQISLEPARILDFLAIVLYHKYQKIANYSLKLGDLTRGKNPQIQVSMHFLRLEKYSQISIPTQLSPLY